MKFILASALLCCSFAVYAEPENTSIDQQPADTDALDFMLAAGITVGGEDLRTTSGGEVSVSSGGMIYLAAGGVYHVSPNFDVQAAFGYHIDQVKAEDGTASFKRTFIELLPFYVMDGGNRLGIGFTQVMSPKYTDPLDSTLNRTFDNANGMIIEFDWSLAKNSSGFMKDSYIGFRYVNLSYETVYGIELPDRGYTNSVDGSYIGLLIQGNF